MSLVSVCKRITDTCDSTFTPTVIGAVLTVLYFNFHVVALGIAGILLAADLVTTLDSKGNK
jgi:hypothetical protein